MRKPFSLDMTAGAPAKLLLTFAVPLMISGILQQLYTICDSVIVGRLLGSEAFAGIGSASYLNSFPISMMSGLSQGIGVVLSQRFGAKDAESYRRSSAAGTVLAVTLGAVLTLLGVFLLGPFLTLLKTTPELYGYSFRYLRVLWGGFLFTALYNLLNAHLRSVGDSRTPLYTLIAGTLMNIVFDYALMAGLRMGVEGAALATLLAQGISVLMCFLAVRRNRDLLPRRGDWAPRRTVYTALLKLGVPPLLSGAVITTGELAVQTAINVCGTAFVTGMTASRRYFQLLTIAGGGMEAALATYVGQNYGAGEHGRIRRGVRTCVSIGAVMAVAVTASVMLLAEPMIRLFVGSASEEIVAIGTASLRTEAMFVLLLYALVEYRAAISGMGNAVVPMFSGFFELALRFAAVTLLPMLFGRTGLYYTDAVAWTLTAVMLAVSYYVIRRKKLKA